MDVRAATQLGNEEREKFSACTQSNSTGMLLCCAHSCESWIGMFVAMQTGLYCRRGCCDAILALRCEGRNEHRKVPVDALKISTAIHFLSTVFKCIHRFRLELSRYSFFVSLVSSCNVLAFNIAPNHRNLYPRPSRNKTRRSRSTTPAESGVRFLADYAPSCTDYLSNSPEHNIACVLIQAFSS